MMNALEADRSVQVIDEWLRAHPEQRLTIIYDPKGWSNIPSSRVWRISWTFPVNKSLLGVFGTSLNDALHNMRLKIEEATQ